MRAVRLDASSGSLTLVDVPIPEPAGTEVRIRVAGCGVCRTDLHIVDGTQARVVLPRTLGHEVSGWIDASGPNAAPLLRRSHLSAGDATLVSGGWGCGTCADCLAGAEQRCDRSLAPGFQRDGGYAEYMIVPHPRHLVRLGDLDPADAAPLADAGMTAFRAVKRAGPWLAGSPRVLLIGCGGVGGFVLSFLRLRRGGGSARIVVSEADPARVARAIDRGADEALLNADASAAHEALGGPAEVVFDLVGTDDTLSFAADAVAPGGAVVLVGEGGGRLEMSMDRPAIESWFTTVAWGSRDDLREVVRLARVGRLQWDVERTPLAQAAAAHERLRRGEVAGRLVLVP
ncbi:MAG: alcohol dehydrogenase catalytic domain-containing protein [Chloroflexi bacterium]|nr:alcohol dehydrogenase catalytic domain-containing protein [Chloroflexota bacterium]